MNPQRKFLTGMLIITVFILIVALAALYVQMQVSSGNACSCEIPLYVLVPIIGAMGLFIGVLSYYLLSPKFEKPLVDKSRLLDFLGKDEATIMRVILENRGEISQAEIVKQTGLQKVKVFRVLHSLQNRGIVSKEQNRKVKMVRLSQEIRNLLL